MNKNITPRNNKGEPHGLWEDYWDNGNLYYKCICDNGKEVGYEELYWYNGKLNKKRYNI